MAEPVSLTADEWAFWDRWMHAQRLLAQEVDRSLQRDFGISKADFAILMKLDAAASGWMRVTDLADSLDWEKSRVAHQITRMEGRGLLKRNEAGAAGRRTGITLTRSGETVVKDAIRAHAGNVRRLGLDRLSAEQIAAIDAWSSGLIDEYGQGPSTGDELQSPSNDGATSQRRHPSELSRSRTPGPTR